MAATEHADCCRQVWLVPASVNGQVEDNVLERPSSIPPGLRVELSRARVLPGKSELTDRWMAMLNARVDECVATLDREKMALEIVFRRTDDDGEWIYWLSLYGPDGAGLDESVAIDRDHVALGRQCKEPGWEEATPQFFLAPESVRNAIASWATGR
jgi:hypothetical protein